MALDELESRRSALTAIASALAAVALAAAVAGRSCQMDGSAPEAVVREFIAAANADDRAALYALFGPKTHAHLQEAARRATDLAGGAVRYSALDMISVGVADAGLPKQIVLKHRDETEATVEIVDINDKRSEVTLVLIEGAWRIELIEPGLAP